MRSAAPLLGALAALASALLLLAAAGPTPSTLPRARAGEALPLPRAGGGRGEGAPRAEHPPPGPFVRVEGTSFFIGDEPFAFVGANAAVVHGRRHRDALDRVLDAAETDGLRVIRVWALGERPEGAPAWSRDYAFRVGPDGWIAASFEHLDRVLEAARARDLRVIVVLANRWRDYGGAPQYLRWTATPFDPDASEGVPPLELVRFWDCPRCAWLYREHARQVIERVSSITGVAYRDDPTILA